MSKEGENKSAVDFHCNAFIDYCVQSNQEEVCWLNQVFGNWAERKTKFRYQNDSIRFRIHSVYYTVNRQGQLLEGINYDTTAVLLIIRSYPWTPRSDSSASLLTRDILTHIISFLISFPWDMHRFLRVNKLFYQAGIFFSGYQRLIEKKRVAAQVEHLPFAYLAPHQRFFALCFISCKTLRESERQLVNGIVAGEPNLLEYCFNLSGLTKSMGFHPELLLNKNGELWYSSDLLLSSIGHQRSRIVHIVVTAREI